LTELDIHDDCVVTVGGKVEIIVEGKFLIQNNSKFNAGGNPDDVSFYCTNKSPIEKSGDKVDLHDGFNDRNDLVPTRFILVARPPLCPSRC